MAELVPVTAEAGWAVDVTGQVGPGESLGRVLAVS